MLLYFKDKIQNRSAFSQGELSLILGVYGDRVKKGEWRDYAIDILPEMAVFSVFRSARENPIFQVAKIPGRSFLKPPQYAVYAGDKVMKQSTSLSDVLNYFEEEKK